MVARAVSVVGLLGPLFRCAHRPPWTIVYTRNVPRRVAEEVERCLGFVFVGGDWNPAWGRARAHRAIPHARGSGGYHARSVGEHHSADSTGLTLTLARLLFFERALAIGVRGALVNRSARRDHRAVMLAVPQKRRAEGKRASTARCLVFRLLLRRNPRSRRGATWHRSLKKVFSCYAVMCFGSAQTCRYSWRGLRRAALA